MNVQVAFTYNNEKFFTIQNCTYIQSIFKDSNVIRQPDLISKSSYQSEFAKHNNNKNFKATPVMEVDSVEQTGKYFNVTGTVEIDDVKYRVELTREKLQFLPIDLEEPVVEEATEELGVATESKSEEVKSEELEPTEAESRESEPEEPEPEESKAQEPFPDIEPLEEADIVEDIAEPEVEPITAKEVEKENGSVVSKCLHKSASSQDEPKLVKLALGNTRSTRNCLEFKEKIMPTQGIVFGKRETTVTADITMGVKDRAPAGISFGQRTVPNNASRNFLRSEALRKQAIQRQLDKEIEEEIDTERLQKSWSQPMSAKQRFDSLQPAPTEFNPEPITESETVVTADVSDKETPSKTARDEAKAAVRAELSDEFNKVIGDIPVDLLGSIAEFTMEPINSVEVLNGKDMLCIDRRWHKHGKWFCIDVVPNTSRYFYNSRLGVNIEIPIAILKAWKEALET